MEENDDLRNRIIGLGDFSIKKSYFPELQNKIGELNLFKKVFESTIDMMIVFRCQDGYVEYINDAAIGFFKLQNDPYRKYISDFTSDKFWYKIKKRLNEQKIKTTPSLFKSIILIDKIEYYIQSSLSLIVSNDIFYGSLIIRDISLNVRKELELTEAKEKAEESEKLKASFLANMSHEIRTPLNAIIGFSNLLDNDLEGDIRRKYIDIIENNSNDLLCLINDILDVSKLDAGLFKISLKSFNVNNICDELFNQYHQKIKENENHLNLLYKKGCPDEKAFIESDSTRLKQVLINLIDNAIKFTISGTITFGYELKEPYLQFYVKDTGQGIPVQSLKIIFDRFRQDDSLYTKHPGGTGLGLSICKGLVELLGGSIWVESMEGIGSTFYFTIPYKLMTEL